MLILDLWGISFHPVVVVGLGNDLLFNFIVGHCDTQAEISIKSKHSLNNYFIFQGCRKDGGVNCTPTQNMTDQLTLFQPGGADYAPNFTTCPAYPILRRCAATSVFNQLEFRH